MPPYAAIPSILHCGISSAKVLFPSMSRSQPPSVKDLEAIENAVAQMELWNSLVCRPSPKEIAVPFSPGVVNTVDAQAEEKLMNDVSVAGTEDEESSIVQAFPIDNHASNPTGDTVHEPISAEEVFENDVKAEDDTPDEGPPTKNDVEYSRVEHASVQCADRHVKGPVAIASPHPLQPLNAVVSASRKESVSPYYFTFKRKRIPDALNLSLPAKLPRSLSLAVAEDVDSSSILDSGISLDRYEVDPGKPIEQTQVPRDVVIHNLVLRKVLGVGAQGKVYLAQTPRRKGSKKPLLFAVKVMIKGRYDDYRMILQEQDVMKRLRGHRFLLQLEGSFHDTRNFYLISQYHAGRDLHDLLRHRGSLDISTTRFYAAELCSAVAFLHQNWIVHRDIKLSNVLIKADGHICLGDFGLCTDCSSQKPTGANEDCFLSDAEPLICGIAGTTAYMAPEVIRGEIYSYKVDWWSCGVTIYNLLEGHFPWPVTDKLWLAEMAGIVPPGFRTTTDIHARSFVERMLRKDPKERLGTLDVFSHPFFDGIDVQDIHSGKLRPPYVPTADTREHVASLRASDGICTGGKYSSRNIPTAQFIFYGSNLNAPELPTSFASGTFVDASSNLLKSRIPLDDHTSHPSPKSLSTLPSPTSRFASGKTLTVDVPITPKYPVKLDDSPGWSSAVHETINKVVPGTPIEDAIELEGCERSLVGKSERQVEQLCFASSHFDYTKEPDTLSLLIPVQKSCDERSFRFLGPSHGRETSRVLEDIEAHSHRDCTFPGNKMSVFDMPIQDNATAKGIETTSDSMAIPPIGIDRIDDVDEPSNENRQSNMVKSCSTTETVSVSWAPSFSRYTGPLNDGTGLVDPSFGPNVFACGLPNVSVSSSCLNLGHSVDFESTLDDAPMVSIDLGEPCLSVLSPERQLQDQGVHFGTTSRTFLNLNTIVQWVKRLNYFLVSNWKRVTRHNTMRDVQASFTRPDNVPGYSGPLPISL